MAITKEPELSNLKIDRLHKRGNNGEASPWATRWILAGVALLVFLGAGLLVLGKLNPATEVETTRVRAVTAFTPGEGNVILNATGYIIPAHKIEVASKVVGKVSWIGVEKGDSVQQGQVLVRLEDDEYRARLLEARGQLNTLEARLAELLNGSRPEEISRANADVNQAKADVENARVNLSRVQQLVREGVMPKQALDDAQARFDAQEARKASLERSSDLVKIGPRKEQIDAMQGQVEQARGSVAFAQTQVDNTVIRAPVSGTILERNVEKGEFVTTGFVGERGAKGYVVSLANLNDLQVELDINQNDFAKLGPNQKGAVTTDAYPDRKYEGVIQEISPEANRQKATVQVKVKILQPDQYLRPEMNASVAFVSDGTPVGAGTQKPMITVPANAIRNNTVFVIVDGKAAQRAVKTRGTTSAGVQIDSGLSGGEDLIVNPPADLKDGQRVKAKSA